MFGDFQCPFTQRTLATVTRLRKDYPDELRTVFKHQPLPFHPQARASARVEAIIAADQEQAKRVGATGAPAFYINGVQLVGARPIEDFWSLIDSEITGRPPVKPAPPSDDEVVQIPDGKSPVLGRKKAPITLVMFGDFECSFTRRCFRRSASFRPRKETGCASCSSSGRSGSIRARALPRPRHSPPTSRGSSGSTPTR